MAQHDSSSSVLEAPNSNHESRTSQASSVSASDGDVFVGRPSGHAEQNPPQTASTLRRKSSRALTHARLAKAHAAAAWEAAGSGDSDAAAQTRRLVLHFVPGLHELSDHTPPALAARGVGHEDWLRHASLLRDVQSLAPNRARELLCFASLVLVPWALKQRQRHLMALQHWAQGINSELLQPRGMFARVGVDGGYCEMPGVWVSIAFTHRDVKRMQAEPHAQARHSPRATVRVAPHVGFQQGAAEERHNG